MPHPQPDGYLAVPPTGTGPGVLVLHAWGGVTVALDTGSLNLTARRHTTRRQRAWRGIKPWLSWGVPPPGEPNQCAAA